MFKKITFVITLCFLLTTSVFAANPPKNIISMEQATAIATKTQQGTIESKELEFEKDKWVYSFDIRASDKRIHEIQVEAKSGKVVSKIIESKKQEAAESAKDKKKTNP